MSKLWTSLLELNEERQVVSGNAGVLAGSIRNAADLRIYTEFVHNQHIDTRSENNELVREVSEFRTTYLLDDRWTAGIMTLRQPIDLPMAFGPRASMSFFLYNEDGQQACARPYLDGNSPLQPPGNEVAGAQPALIPNCDPQRHTVQLRSDEGTNAPILNFVYDFRCYRFAVCDNWREVLGHDADGTVARGRLDDLTDAFAAGCEVKVAVAGLCDDLCDSPERAMRHEVFIQAGPAYHSTRSEHFMVGTHPLVRVAPAVPLVYQSRRWDFGWLVVRSDGRVIYRRCDPYTLAFSDHTMRRSLRWFVR